MQSLLSSLARRLATAAFLALTWLQLYFLGARYVIHELRRKLSHQPDVRSALPQDLRGVRVLLTGGSRGIGLCAAEELLRRGAELIVGSTRPTAAHRLKALGADVRSLDLNSLDSVDSFASRLLNERRPLHVLLLNAGVMFLPHATTADGFETHFQTNFLAHALLALRLLPLLVCESPAVDLRVVHVASSTHRARALCLTDLQSRARYSPFHAYAQSKLAQIAWSAAFARWLNKHRPNVSSVSLHPGVACTELYEHVWWVRLWPGLARLLMRSPEQAADTLLHAALTKNLLSGAYFEDCQRSAPSKSASDAHVQDAIWRWTADALRTRLCDWPLDVDSLDQLPDGE